METRTLTGAMRVPAPPGGSPAGIATWPDGVPQAVPPEVVMAVENVWRRVLRRPTGADRSWADLGGEARQLPSCVAEMEAEFAVALRSDRFRADMTAREFAAAIVRERARDGVDGAARPTVAVFPGFGGDGPGLMLLRANLGGRFRFVVVDYPGWRDMLGRIGRIEDLADAARRQIGRMAPRGCVALVGYSFGGAIAYEMAAQSARDGRAAGALVILDTPVFPEAFPNMRKMRLWPGGATLQRIAATPALSRGQLQSMACRFAARLLVRAGERTLLPLLAGTRFGFVPSAMRALLERELTETLQERLAIRWLGQGPPPDVPPVGATVFRSDDPLLRMRPDRGWTAYVQKLDFVDVGGGDHIGILRHPHRARLAAGLAEVLAQAAAREGRGHDPG